MIIIPWHLLFLSVCINDCCYQIKNFNCKQQIVTVVCLHNSCDVCSRQACSSHNSTWLYLFVKSDIKKQIVRRWHCLVCCRSAACINSSLRGEVSTYPTKTQPAEQGNSWQTPIMMFTNIDTMKIIIIKEQKDHTTYWATIQVLFSYWLRPLKGNEGQSQNWSGIICCFH